MKITSLMSLCILMTAAAFGQAKQANMHISVIDGADKFVADLKVTDLTATGTKAAVSIESLTLSSGSALDVLILVDASASQERVLPLGKNAAKYFIDTILDGNVDRVAIAKLASKIEMVEEISGDLASAKAAIDRIEIEVPPGYIGGGVVAGRGSSNNQRPGPGSTSLWESLTKSIDGLSSLRAPGRRQAVIMVTDGVNTAGEAKLNDAVEFAIAKQIPVYSIGVGDNFYDGIDEKALRKLSERSGGMLVLLSKKLEKSHSTIKRFGEALRSWYELTLLVQPTDKKTGVREIEISLSNPELQTKKLTIVKQQGVVLQD